MKKTSVGFIAVALILFFVSFAVINSFGSFFPSLSTENQTLTIHQDRLSDTLYRISPDFSYLPGLNSYNDIQVKQGIGLTELKKIDGRKNTTLFMKVESNVDEMVLVIKNLQLDFTLFVDDHEVGVFNVNDRHLISLSGMSNAHYLILFIKENNTGIVSLPTLFISTKNFADNFYLITDGLQMITIGILLCGLIFMLLFFMMHEKKLFNIIVAGFYASIIAFLILINILPFSYFNNLLIFSPLKIIIIALIAAIALFEYLLSNEEEELAHKKKMWRIKMSIFSVGLAIAFISMLVPQLYIVSVLYFLFCIGLLYLEKKPTRLSFMVASIVIIGFAFLFRDSLKVYVYLPSVIDDFITPVSMIGIAILLAMPLKTVASFKETGKAALLSAERKYTNHAKSSEVNSRLKVELDEMRAAYNKLQTIQENNQNLMLNISHDLRTPLSIIDGYLQVLRQDDIKPEVKAHYYVRIYAKLDYLKKLIADLFLVAKMEEGNFQLAFEEIDVVAFTHNLIGDYQLMAEAKGLNYNMKLASGFLVKLIDTKQYPRIIENIITNAIKYNKKDGSINIETSVIEIEGESKFRVIVEDTGIGINDKDLPRIFGSYYLEKRRSNQNDSSGVGLFITKQLADRHKAKLWVESVKDKGTRFFFEI